MSETTTNDQEQTQTAEPKVNIRLTADTKIAPVAVDGDVNIGMHEAIHLPDEETQRAGWYEPKAHLLLTLYPGIYKRPTDK